MGKKELSTSFVEETEEEFKERLSKASKILERQCISFEFGGEITSSEIKGRFLELEYVRWYVGPYENLKDNQLKDRFYELKKEIKAINLKPAYFDR